MVRPCSHCGSSCAAAPSQQLSQGLQTSLVVFSSFWTNLDRNDSLTLDDPQILLFLRSNNRARVCFVLNTKAPGVPRIEACYPSKM